LTNEQLCANILLLSFKKAAGAALPDFPFGLHPTFKSELRLFGKALMA